MSTHNIVSQGWIPMGDAALYYIVFALHHGGTAKYIYDEGSGLAIENGSDPRDLTPLRRQ